MNRFRRTIVAIFVAGYCGTAFGQVTAHEWAVSTSLAPGIEYTSMRVAEPRPYAIYCIRIDTREPGLTFHTTGRHPQWRENAEETVRTRDFVREKRAAGLDIVAAINVDAFEPWPAPWNQRTATNLRGLAVSEGVVVSPPSDSPSFVVDDEGRVAVVQAVEDVAALRLAVSGFGLVLWDGEVLEGNDSIHPRTGIGVCADARYVYWVVVDGRRHASQGATTAELGQWLLYFGAEDGINLDGGGSSTMVRYDPHAAGDGVVLLNEPVGNSTNWLEQAPEVEREHYTPTERANGNNLGVSVPR